MKAAVRSRYGIPGDLSIKELAMPVPKGNEVLIKVHATTVNRSDCHVLSGRPYFMRLFTGLLKPKSSIIGSDFAGEIALTGHEVLSFKKGERIMGFGGVFGCGSHAQYFTLPETKAKVSMVVMPDDLDFDLAAASLEGAFYAGSTILKLKPKPGQKALVYGAGGAIGSSYIQFLKHFQVYVTAVCSSRQIELIKSLGADKVIDYETNDFTKDTERYDFVFDAVNKTGFFKCKHLLNDRGIYVSSGGFEYLFLAFFTSFTNGRKVIFHPPDNLHTTLGFIRDLIGKGDFRPVIDRRYPLDQVTEAFRYVASGNKTGNVVITMDT